VNLPAFRRVGVGDEGDTNREGIAATDAVRMLTASYQFG
jgi:hypothetical protein